MSVDSVSLSQLSTQSSQVSLSLGSQPSQNKRKRKPRVYKPQYRSGGYGILMSLYEQSLKVDDLSDPEISVELTKSKLVDLAQKYCDKSYTLASNFHYTAWSSMNTLLDKDLVFKQGFPPKYSLTQSGIDIASELWQKTVQMDSRNFSKPKVTPSPPKSRLELPDKPVDTSLNNIPFMFRYVSPQGIDVDDKDDAMCHVRNQTIFFKIKYHKSQKVHEMTNHLTKIENVSGADEFLYGFLKDELAPRTCPGLNKSILSGNFSFETCLSSPSGSTLSPEKHLADKIMSPSLRGKLLSTNVGNSIGSSLDLYNSPLQNFSAVGVRKFQSPKKRKIGSSQALGGDGQENRSINVSKLWPTAPEPEQAEISCTASSFITFPPESFEVCMLIDNREVKSKDDRQFIQKKIAERGVLCEQRALELGDVMWVARPKIRVPNGEFHEVVLNSLVERKRIDDLESSIKDGRFKEQKNRLRKCGVHEIWYLVEELTGFNTDDIGKYSLRSAILETQIFDDIKVYRTQNLEESIEFLFQLHEKMCQMYLHENLQIIAPGLVNGSNFAQIQERLSAEFGCQFHFIYEEFGLLNSKSKAKTIKDVWFKQLMTIKGLSAEKASVIVNRFPTMDSFFRELQKHDSFEGKIKMLRETDGPVKSKNIGPSLAKKIVDLFCQERCYDN